MSVSSSHPTPNLSDVFAYIDAHRQQFLDRLIDYVRRPGISAYGEGIDVVADYIAGGHAPGRSERTHHAY